ncbi:MAG: hypothetical protein R3176_07130 [Woeseiaceae bacterium]|nr:hypothetical protein [Woeseiaceae bacterium]
MQLHGYCVVSGALFALVAVVHLLRIAYGIDVTIDGIAVPLSVSWIAVVVPGALVAWALRTARSGRTAP